MRRGTVRIARTVLAILGLLNVGTGGWALISPGSWYANYPGFGRHWLPSTGPFNEHLASDAGAGFLAVGVALLIAAVWMARPVVQLALVTQLAQALPHFVFHITHPDNALATADVLVGVWGIAAQSAVAVALFVAVSRPAQRHVVADQRSRHDDRSDGTAGPAG